MEGSEEKVRGKEERRSSDDEDEEEVVELSSSPSFVELATKLLPSHPNTSLSVFPILALYPSKLISSPVISKPSSPPFWTSSASCFKKLLCLFSSSLSAIATSVERGIERSVPTPTGRGRE